MKPAQVISLMVKDTANGVKVSASRVPRVRGSDEQRLKLAYLRGLP